ncbi:GNAT family N-acetyltransferase [Phaeobacter porticola]|uniref:Acetyltransferase domain-containing protein n=1 Tax=Phaeobacter porticola TaxID=1844006 RepID=A0A1L3I6B7_9RHOB|nr:GNAT family N-acetyltransferase [Phaeobacter porticola]APG47561.1 acetyltransferase domain-containing protein [Phaeobacter porticola]
MDLIDIPPTDAHRLVPLLQKLQALHVTHQPGRYAANPSDAALTNWLGDWLTDESLTARAAVSPTGAIMGYIIYGIEERPALPVRRAETRAMLHHIAVADSWQRMGVGTALIAEMKRAVNAQGINIIATTYAPFNTASAALMARMGLRPVMTTAEWRGES